MRKIVLRNGLLGIVLMVLIFVPEFFIFRSKHNWELQEVLGWVTIVLSLLFVFIAIKQWRDQHNNGILTFGQGLKLGTLITLFPSVAFGLLSWLEVWIDPKFMDEYYAHYLEKLKQSTPPDKLPAALREFESQREMFNSPFMQFALMFISVFIIGIIITIISTMILRRKGPKVSMAYNKK